MARRVPLCLRATSHKLYDWVCEEYTLEGIPMIHTKPTLKSLLDYATELIDCTLDERKLHKELKCLLVEYELYREERVYNDIFVKFLNLCHIKY